MLVNHAAPAVAAARCLLVFFLNRGVATLVSAVAVTRPVSNGLVLCTLMFADTEMMGKKVLVLW